MSPGKPQVQQVTASVRGEQVGAGLVYVILMHLVILSGAVVISTSDNNATPCK